MRDFHYTGGGDHLPLLLVDNCPVVPAAADGIAGQFEIDTGASSSIVLQAGFAERHDLRIRHPGGLRMTAAGIDGTFETVVARLDRFRIGKATIERPAAEFPLNGKNGLPLQGVDGIVGYQVLRQFVITFDYSRNEVWLERSPAFGTKAGQWKSGLQAVKTNAGDFRVLAVLPNSPAAIAGIHDGDIITEINGKSAPSVGQAEFADMMRRSDGVLIALEVVRNGRPSSVTEPKGVAAVRASIVALARVSISGPSL